MTDIYQQGPVSSLRGSDLIVIRQSNGRDMYLPVSVLVTYVTQAIVEALNVVQLPAERINGLAAVATTGQIAAEDVQGLALVAKTGKYSDLHGKPGDPPGPP